MQPCRAAERFPKIIALDRLTTNYFRYHLTMNLLIHDLMEKLHAVGSPESWAKDPCRKLHFATLAGMVWMRYLP